LQPGDKLILYSDGAEPFIGYFDDMAGFRFNEEFCRIKDLSIVEIMDRLKEFAQNKEVDPTEVDDITAIGLEIIDGF